MESQRIRDPVRDRLQTFIRNVFISYHYLELYMYYMIS